MAHIQYLCRLPSGEVTAATVAVAETEAKATIYANRKGGEPIVVTAARPDESLPDRPETGPFEEEITERLTRAVNGMMEGENKAPGAYGPADCAAG